VTTAAETSTEPWTIARLLRWAAEDFTKRGIATARLDAELLLGKVLGLDRVKMIVEGLRVLSDAELALYRDLIKRRRSYEPMAYILGEREFYALPIRVDRRVLIPRPDTEALVDVALERTASRSMYARALDLCTGSGCVAIAIAEKRPTWHLTAVDLSEDAAIVARENSLRCGVVRQISVMTGDLFTPVDPNARFELVTANAPYIPSGEIAGLEAQVRDFEPRAALDGGVDGLDLIRRIVTEAPRFLSSGGVLALEVAWNQAPSVSELLARSGFDAIERRKDYGGHERVVSGRMP
jgi:release factor glutamine methyltransferase